MLSWVKERMGNEDTDEELSQKLLLGRKELLGNVAQKIVLGKGCRIESVWNVQKTAGRRQRVSRGTSLALVSQRGDLWRLRGSEGGPAETQALWAGGKHRGRGLTAALILLSEVGTSGSTVRPGEVRSLFTRVCFQDAKKSRLPVLIKPSQSLGSVCRPPASQEVVAHLQAEVLKLQGELKELKIHNRQLHQKLILVEAMTEGQPVPEEALPKGKHQGKRVLREKMDGPTARPKMSAVLFGIAIGWRINFLSCSD